MRIAPIIHTRTFFCDFNSEFLVRPNCFMDSDIKWARKYVLGATASIDTLQGVRWLISDNGKYRMAGVVGFLKSICSKCQLSEDERLKSEELFCDDKGRLIYAFIGVVIDKNNNDNYENLSLNFLWKLYLDEIYPIWKRTYQEIKLEDFRTVDAKEKLDTVANELVESDLVDLKNIYEANPVTDYQLFVHFFADRDKSEFSFCSNIIDFNIVKQSVYSIITTSKNIIDRIGRDKENKSNSNKNEIPYQIPFSSENVEQSQTPKKKI